MSENILGCWSSLSHGCFEVGGCVVVSAFHFLIYIAHTRFFAVAWWHAIGLLASTGVSADRVVPFFFRLFFLERLDFLSPRVVRSIG